eukprot:scaffold3542_cov113-Isochrysis_galbana.AAC.7
MGKPRVRPVFVSVAVRNLTTPVAGCRTRSSRTVTDCDSARACRAKAASQPTTRGRRRSGKRASWCRASTCGRRARPLNARRELLATPRGSRGSERGGTCRPGR